MKADGPLLIDPDQSRLASALSDLADTARLRPFIEHLQQAMRERPLGSITRNGGSRQNKPVEAAWWTDHQGRRQVRLRRSRDDGKGPPWHPLGNVHPGILFKIERSEETHWVAVCRCGEAGLPERLAWMGPWCGPCHDRAEEGAPLPEPYPAIQALPGPSEWLGWRAGGASLYTSTIGFDLARFDLIEGEWKPSDDWKNVTTWTRNGLVPSPTDPHLAACYDTDRRQIRLLDERGQLRQALLLAREASRPPALTFSADGQALAFAGGTAGWQVFRLGANGFESTLRHDSFASEIAFSPDGSLLALRGPDGGAVRLADAVTGMTREFFHAAGATRLAGFALDGTRLVLIGEGYEEQAQVWSLSPPARVCHFRLRHVVGARLTPCGRYLLWQPDPSAGHTLRLSCLSTGKQLASLCIDPSTGVNFYAFSPDGQWLAMTDGRSNLRVVRWPALLGAMLTTD